MSTLPAYIAFNGRCRVRDACRKAVDHRRESQFCIGNMREIERCREPERDVAMGIFLRQLTNESDHKANLTICSCQSGITVYGFNISFFFFYKSAINLQLGTE